MAIQFKNLKSPLLGLQDKITVGKLAGCRVCDVIEDHHEYLIWADKSGLMKFQAIVAETIAEHAGFKAQQQHYEEEIKPWLESEIKTLNPIIDEDVPF